jgi:hypothetical protein
MTIPVELPAEFESTLREEARKADLDPGAYVVRALCEHLRKRQKLPPSVPRPEAELLEKVNLGFSQEEWQRYHALIGKRWAETLTEEDQRELIGLSDRLEKANARRMEALAELASRRGVSFETLMKDLGIESPPYV